jgi:ketosteroid isomerase-like protein
MSRENVEAAREIIAAISCRDLSRLLELTDPEIEWRSFFAALSSEAGEYRGHEGMRRYIGDLNEVFEWLRPEVGDLLDAGDLVVGHGRIYYRGKGSGVETDSPAGWVFRFRDSKLLRFRAFRDPEQALEAVGLSD